MNKTVNSNSKELLPVTKFTECCDADAAGKILGVSANATVINTEALNRELRVTVAVSFNTITADGDGYDTEVFKTESTVSVMADCITPSTKGVVFASVADCRSEKRGFCADIELSGWVLKENEVIYLDEAPEDVICRTGKYEVDNIVCADSTQITLTDSNEARLPIKKIMNFSAAVTVNNIYPSQGSFQVDGETILRLVALSDSGIFVNQTFVNPFSTEIPCDSSTPDSEIDLYAQAIKSNLTVTDGDARVFVTETDIRFSYALSEKTEIEGPVDCYSKTNDLLIEESVSSVNSCSCFRTVRDKTSAYIKCEAVVDEVLCATTPCISDVSVVMGDSLKVEGLVTTSVIYSDENGTKAERCEIPFSTVISADFDCRDSFFPEVKITSLGARARSATEIEVTAELCIALRAANSHELKMISSIEKGAEKIDPGYAISLYIVKPGETVWDVAKALNTDEETVLRLNPELELPLKGGEKILVYNELV